MLTVKISIGTKIYVGYLFLYLSCWLCRTDKHLYTYCVDSRFCFVVSSISSAFSTSEALTKKTKNKYQVNKHTVYILDKNFKSWTKQLILLFLDKAIKQNYNILS